MKGEGAKRVASGGGHFRPTSDELGLRLDKCSPHEIGGDTRVCEWEVGARVSGLFLLPP